MTAIAGTSASCLYLAPNSESVLALSTIFLALGVVCVNVLITITLEIFPTNLRYVCAASVTGIYRKREKHLWHLVSFKIVFEL